MRLALMLTLKTQKEERKKEDITGVKPKADADYVGWHDAVGFGVCRFVGRSFF